MDRAAGGTNSSNEGAVEAAHRRLPASPPRLVLRFTILTSIGLAIAGASIFLFVRGFMVRQQEESARIHARFVTEVVLGKKLRPSDFRAPVSGARLHALDRLARTNVLVAGIVRADFVSRSGRVSYSTQHGQIGQRSPISSVAVAATRGRVVTSVLGSVTVGARPARVLNVLVPVRFAGYGTVGALVLSNDYRPIARSARSAFLPIAIVLEALLMLLFGGIFPVLRRVTREMRSHLEQSEHRAFHDSLTGLPNRALFSDRLQNALAASARTGTKTAVFLVDLDRFKEINDTLGHAVGDALLKDLGCRLATSVRNSDTIARLGGDEFGMLMTIGVDAEGVAAAAQRILGALDRPFEIEGHSLVVGASIGVALYPEHGSSVASLLKHADVAMYEAKRHRTGYEIYNSATDSNTASQLALRHQVHGALEREELALYYQPEFDLQTGSVSGAEALLRWHHPTRGLVSAGEFIGLLDQTGLARSIADFTLKSAVQQAAAWRREGLEIVVAVNLDARSLLDLELPSRLERLITASGGPPSMLEIEITETSIMADPGRAQKVATALAALGVHLAVDDFGTGYSSLSYLTRLPISKLKIDRSFVRRIDEAEADHMIVKATIDLAHSLGLKVVAEGVDTAESARALRQLGCDLAQGFHLGRPMAPDLLNGVARAHTLATRRRARTLTAASGVRR